MKHLLKNVFARYLHYLPLLFLAGLFYAGVWVIVTNFYPHEIQNWLIPGSFLPLLVALFFGHFFFFSFWFINTRRGILMSLYLTLVVFFWLHGVLSPLLVTGPLAAFLVLEVLLWTTQHPTGQKTRSLKRAPLKKG